MKFRNLLALFLGIQAIFAPLALVAQEPTAEQQEQVAAIEKNLKYDDYQVKAYRITLFGGQFSGATYLENKELGPRTILTDGAGDILGYDGNVLSQSTDRFANNRHIFDAATKEIKPGTAYGGRLGIYVSKDFHLDLLGTYATGKAVTTMLRHQENDPTISVREVVDEDNGFKVIKGGAALMYDASPATLFGVMPRLGFSLGGIINRYSRGIQDKTALYVEGNFGLSTELFNNLNLTGQVDLTTFAFQVDELGYSNMVNYATFSLGLSWFIDVVPANVREAHLAELRAAEE